MLPAVLAAIVLAGDFNGTVDVVKAVSFTALFCGLTLRSERRRFVADELPPAPADSTVAPGAVLTPRRWVLLALAYVVLFGAVALVAPDASFAVLGHPAGLTIATLAQALWVRRRARATGTEVLYRRAQGRDERFYARPLPPALGV